VTAAIQGASNERPWTPHTLSFSHCFESHQDQPFTKNPYNRFQRKEGNKPNLMMRAAVITVSDSCFRGQRVDISGPAVAELLQANAFSVISHLVVPDEQGEIEDALRQQCEVANLVVTTGGTGVAPRDVTPEATRAVCDRLLEGFAELMRSEGRKQTRFAPLSRSISGTRGRCLIVNLPGSPRGARGSLEAVLPLIPHALTLLEGTATHHEEDDAG
jgi:molybdopterin adenylyltransferase